MKVVYFAPKGFGYSTNQVAEGFHLLDKAGVVDFYCTSKVVHHGAKLEDLQTVSDEEAWEHAQDADMCIVASDGDADFHHGYSGRCIGENNMMRKTVFVDGHDGGDLILEPRRVRLYLKRENRYPNLLSYSADNIRCHPFGVYDFHFDQPAPGYADRDIDVAFMAFGGSSETRHQVAKATIDVCEREGLTHRVHISNDSQPIPGDEYRQVMRSAKVGVSTWGAGCDTLRFWETMGFGAVLVSMDMSQLYIDKPPRHMEHGMFMRSTGLIEYWLEKLCRSERLWSRLRRNTDHFILKHHSTKARALQIMRQFQEFE